MYKLEFHRRSFFCWVAGLFGVSLAAKHSKIYHLSTPARMGQHERMLRLIQSATSTPPDSQRDHDYIEFWNSYERAH